MNNELKLALEAIDEIEDVNKWEEAFINTIAECTLQVELSIDKDNASHLISLKDNELILSYPNVFQSVCMKKLIQYREKIFKQNEVLCEKDEEIERLYEENNHLREVNNSFLENIENLKKYLEKADIANITLRSENTDLLHKVRSLEKSISHIENKSAEVVDQLVAEESEKQTIQINNLEELISRQNNVIQKLQKDIEDYELLKAQNEMLLKENKTIEPLKKEITRLENTLSQFYKDYQDLIGIISHEPCSCAPSIEIKKEEGASTTTSRNQIESDDESQNKNITLNKANSRSLTPKETSHRQNMSSLMEEIIITKFSGTPVSGDRNSNAKSTENIHQQKIKTPKAFKSIDMSKKIRNKNQHSNSVQMAARTGGKAFQEGLQSEYNTNLIEELQNEGDFAKKTREIIASELESEDERDERDYREEREEEKIGSDSTPFRGSSGNQDLINMFEDEKILLSWDEEDFKRLPSISGVSNSKKSFQDINDSIKRNSILEEPEVIPNRRRKTMIGATGAQTKIYAQTTTKKNLHKRSETTKNDIMSFPSSIIKRNKLRTISLGFMLVQKLSNLKSEKNLQSELSKQELDINSLHNNRASSLSPEAKRGGTLEVVEDDQAESFEASPRRFSFQYQIERGREFEKEKVQEKRAVPTFDSLQTYLLTPGRDNEPEEKEKGSKILIKENVLCINNSDKETQTDSLEENGNNKKVIINKEMQTQTDFRQTDEIRASYISRGRNDTLLTDTSPMNMSTNLDKSMNKSRMKDDRGILTSVVLHALPLSAGASLTYLYMNKKNYELENKIC